MHSLNTTSQQYDNELNIVKNEKYSSPRYNAFIYAIIYMIATLICSIAAAFFREAFAAWLTLAACSTIYLSVQMREFSTYKRQQIGIAYTLQVKNQTFNYPSLLKQVNL